MVKIIDNRGTGKTTRLISIAKESGSIIVCKVPNYIIEKMYKLGITGVEIISYDEFINLEPTHYERTYLIDELDEFVKYFISKKGLGNLYGFSVTENE